jgi:hypothetical protein
MTQIRATTEAVLILAFRARPYIAFEKVIAWEARKQQKSCGLVPGRGTGQDGKQEPFFGISQVVGAPFLRPLEARDLHSAPNIAGKLTFLARARFPLPPSETRKQLVGAS